MIKSRLRLRRETKTVSVKVKTKTAGQAKHTESNAYTSLVATHEPRQAEEMATDSGALVVVTDVFWFEAAAGESLPAIEEKHVLVDAASVRYEVVSVADQGGGGDRLKVMTRRLR